MKKYTMFKQVCNIIPPHLVNRVEKGYRVDEKRRMFLPWSHVVALIYAHLTHAIGLNDVCDACGGPVLGDDESSDIEAKIG